VLQTEAQQQQHEADLRRVLEAGGGCATLIVLGPKSSAQLLRDVADGDAQAIGVLQAADQLLRKIQRRSRANAMPCWFCGGALWRCAPAAALGLLVPLGVVPVRSVVALAFCADCNRDERELGKLAVQKMRAEMMPDLRLLPAVMAQVGHA
jgi:hypothetical protein